MFYTLCQRGKSKTFVLIFLDLTSYVCYVKPMTLAKAEQFLTQITSGLTSEQLRYFSWLVTGFTSDEVVKRLNVSDKELKSWRKVEGFIAVEQAVTTELRNEFTEELSKQENLKNHRRLQELEAQLLERALLPQGMVSFTDEEMKLLQVIFRRHDPNITTLLGTKSVELPTDWKTMVIMMQRGDDGKGEKRDEGDTEIIDSEIHIIKEEYTEGPG